MSQNGILYDSSLVAPSPILCWSWIFFNNSGSATVSADVDNSHEILYNTQALQGKLSCLTSFMPDIRNYQWTLENTKSYPSDTPYELTTASSFKKSLEHFSEYHIDWISLRKFKHQYFTILSDFGCQMLYQDHAAHETKGYLFSSSERWVQLWLELNEQIQAGAILNVTIYLEGPSIMVIKPNGQLHLME